MYPLHSGKLSLRSPEASALLKGLVCCIGFRGPDVEIWSHVAVVHMGAMSCEGSPSKVAEFEYSLR